MTEPTEQIHLLQQASEEIKRLRNSNDKMSIRLKMFDDIMLLLHNPIKYNGMSEKVQIYYTKLTNY